MADEKVSKRVMRSYRLPQSIIDRIRVVGVKLDKNDVQIVEEALRAYLPKVEKQIKEGSI